MLRDWPVDGQPPPRRPVPGSLARVRALYAEALLLEAVANFAPEKRILVLTKYEDLANQFFVPAMFRLGFVSYGWGYEMQALYWLLQASQFLHPFALAWWSMNKEAFKDYVTVDHASIMTYSYDMLSGCKSLFSEGNFIANITTTPPMTCDRERYFVAHLPAEAENRAPIVLYLYAWFIEHGMLDAPVGESIQSLYESAAGQDCPSAYIALARIQLAKEPVDVELAREPLYRALFLLSPAFLANEQHSSHHLDLPHALHWLGYLYLRAGDHNRALTYLTLAANYGWRESRYLLSLERSGMEARFWACLAAFRGHPASQSSLHARSTTDENHVSPDVVVQDAPQNGVFVALPLHYARLQVYAGRELYESVMNFRAIEKHEEKEAAKNGGMFKYPFPDVVRYLSLRPLASVLFRQAQSAEQGGNSREAIRLYRESALVERHPHAMFCLASLLRPLTDSAPEEQWDERMYWLQVAATRYGHPFALRELLDAFEQSQGVPRSPLECAYYRSLVAEYGRFKVERDLDTARRRVEPAAAQLSEAAFLLAWLQTASGEDPSAALKFAAERGHAGARLSLLMSALVTPADLRACPDLLEFAFIGKTHQNDPSSVTREAIHKAFTLRYELSEESLCGTPISQRRLQHAHDIPLSLCNKRGAAVVRHLASLAELTAKGYQPALLCSVALYLCHRTLAHSLLESLAESGCLSALIWRAARRGSHLCRPHGAEAAASLLRSSSLRHPGSFEGLARLCDNDCYLSKGDAMAFRLRAARLNFFPALEVLASYYAPIDRALHFYWRARAQPNQLPWHEMAELSAFRDGVASAFTKYGGQEYLPLLYKAVSSASALAHVNATPSSYSPSQPHTQPHSHTHTLPPSATTTHAVTSPHGASITVPAASDKFPRLAVIYLKESQAPVPPLTTSSSHASSSASPSPSTPAANSNNAAARPQLPVHIVGPTSSPPSSSSSSSWDISTPSGPPHFSVDALMAPNNTFSVIVARSSRSTSPLPSSSSHTAPPPTSVSTPKLDRADSKPQLVDKGDHGPSLASAKLERDDSKHNLVVTSNSGAALPKLERTESKPKMDTKSDGGGALPKLEMAESKPTLEKSDSNRSVLLRGSDPSGVEFSLGIFLEYADITGADVAAFMANAERERLDTEEVLLRLSNEELLSLGLSRLGDRKRFISAAQKWQDGRLGSRLPAGTIIRTEEVTVIEPPLGSGNFAAVYHGTFNAAPVALKVLFNVKGDEEEFWKEARTLHDLSVRSHPNVLRFFGLCKLEKPVAGWAFVTEFLGNGSLKDFLVKCGAHLKLHQLYSFARKAAAGMLHLSNQIPPILHRDLGARNLLVGELDERDDTYILRVADFGLARLSDSSGEYIVHGASPARWTAPEVWKDRKHTVAADVYSFGITLWEIFTRGLRPFDDIDDRTVVRKVRDGYKLPISMHDRTLPQELYDLMLECCATDPTARPAWLAIHKRLEALEAMARKQPSFAQLPIAPAASSSSSSSSASSSVSLATSTNSSPSNSSTAALSSHSSSPSSSSSSSSDSGSSFPFADPLSLVEPTLHTAVPKPAAAAAAVAHISAVSSAPASSSLSFSTSADSSFGLVIDSSTHQSNYFVAGPGGFEVVMPHKRNSHGGTPASHHNIGSASSTSSTPSVMPPKMSFAPAYEASRQNSSRPPYDLRASVKEKRVEHLLLYSKAVVACCANGHPVHLRTVLLKECVCGNVVVEDAGWTCAECNSFYCVNCISSQKPAYQFPDHLSKVIEETVDDHSLRALWKDVCENSAATTHRGAGFFLSAFAIKLDEAVTCEECCRVLRAAQAPWMWIHAEHMELRYVCADCMFPYLVKESGVSVLSFMRITARLFTAGEESEAWFPYASHCVCALFADNDARTITLSRLARVVAWFGPLVPIHFHVRAAWLYSRPWFYGDISSAEAASMVEGNGTQGSWLMRFSATEVGGFAFTVLTHNRVTHYRVTRGPRYELVIRVNGVDEVFDSMSALLDGAFRLLRLRQPICTSRLDVFRSNNKLSMHRATFLQLFDNIWACPESAP